MQPSTPRKLTHSERLDLLEEMCVLLSHIATATDDSVEEYTEQLRQKLTFYLLHRMQTGV